MSGTVIIKDKDGNESYVSEHSSQVIDITHAMVHRGQFFSVSKTATLAAAATLDILLTTPNTDTVAHMTAEITTDTLCTGALYEGTTVSDAGTAMTEINNNRNSTTTATVVATHTPTVTGAGTALLVQNIGAGGLQRIGGSAANRHEYMLKKNTKYLFRVTAASNDTNCDIAIYWYEED